MTDHHDNPRTHMQTMSRADERRGTNWAFVGAAVVALAAGIGLLAWFFVPSFSQPDTPQNAGIRSNQTVGVSVQSQQTAPLRVMSPDSTESFSVQRNEQLTGSEAPNLKPLSQDQLQAIHSFVAQHPQEVLPAVNFSIAVGAAVPATAKLLPLPQQLASAMPSYASDEYFVVNNQFVVVERQTRRIVAIVPVANPNSNAKESPNG